MIVYLDATALVKRVTDEPERGALEIHLEDSVTEFDAALMSSSLAKVEIARSLIRAGNMSGDVHAGVSDATNRIELIAIGDDCVNAATDVPGQYVRALDALHVAAARLVGATEFVTYDKRQGVAARAAGFTVVAPGSMVPVSGD